MTYFGIDIGFNLTNKAFKDDLNKVLDRAFNHNIKALICTGTSIQSSIEISYFIQNHKNLFFTAGIHPHVSESYLSASYEEKFKFQQLVNSAVAVGETGLDYFRMISSKQSQQIVFHEHIELAQQNNKPLFIHDRDSFDDCFAILKEHNFPNGVVHCFDCTYDLGKKYLDRGYFLGVSGSLSRNNYNWAGKFPLNKLMVETDAPYLYPKNSLRAEPALKQKNGWRCEPFHLIDVLSHLHQYYPKYNKEEFSKILFDNTVNFFKLNLNSVG